MNPNFVTTFLSLISSINETPPFLKFPFTPKIEGSTFFRNVCKFLPDCTHRHKILD